MRKRCYCSRRDVAWLSVTRRDAGIVYERIKILLNFFFSAL